MTVFSGSDVLSEYRMSTDSLAVWLDTGVEGRLSIVEGASARLSGVEGRQAIVEGASARLSGVEGLAGMCRRFGVPLNIGFSSLSPSLGSGRGLITHTKISTATKTTAITTMVATDTVKAITSWFEVSVVVPVPVVVKVGEEGVGEN